MRDIHKWKDKVEFSLDTRQVFFLFFGLSIAGCAVFVLGLMTGRSTSWQPNMVALSDASHLGFPSAIHASVSNSGPDSAPARGSNLVPILAQADVKTKDRFDAPLQNSIASSAGRVSEGSKKVDSGRIQSSSVSRKASPRRASVHPDEGRKPLRSSSSVKKKPVVNAQESKRNDTLVASISSKPSLHSKNTSQANTSSKSATKPQKSAKAKRSRTFTLMLKSFAEIEDAQHLVNQLKSNGHEVRLESYEARGRTWHRVLLGNFKKWDDGLKAKSKFEKSEHLIAWLIVKPES